MVLKHTYVTEKASMMLEEEGVLQFLVDRDATKTEIAQEIEELFEKQVTSVRTMNTMKGKKKAIVRFEERNAAEEILSRLGIM
ncbi:MAG: 50S ribosomal protein L23 [Methanomicrobiales archaeon]